MLVLPEAAEPLVRSFRCAFTRRRSFDRFVLLCVGGIVTFGRRTVSRILWTLAGAAPGHPSSYHRLFSQARWSLWALGKALAAAVLELVPPDRVVAVAIDDSVTQHKGSKVYGKGCHRDAVRSTHGDGGGKGELVKKWGHRWVTLAVLLPLPFARRPWALPVLCALYRVPRVDEAEGRRHKTPCELARGLLAALLHWFPRRRFAVMVDGGLSAHDLAWFCRRHRGRTTLVGRLPADARLFALPSRPVHPRTRQRWRREARQGKQRRRRCRKGRRLPSPRETVERVRRQHHAAAGRRRAAPRTLPTRELRWYGASLRDMELLSGCGGWYRGRGDGSAALVPLRWVCSRTPGGDRDDYFFSTDPTLAPSQVVEHFACRWSIEVTFEEARAHLGLETPRQRCRNSVLRTTPCLLGCFSLVSLIFARLWQAERRGGARRQWRRLHQTPCYRKSEPTFADALFAVRRSLWHRHLLERLIGHRPAKMLPRRATRTLIRYLAEAA